MPCSATPARWIVANKEHRFVLSLGNFSRLVDGKDVILTNGFGPEAFSVRIILADIGFNAMRTAISEAESHHQGEKVMNIHSYPDEHFWAVEAANRAGDFLKSFATAALRADSTNYFIIRSALLLLMEKYPEYKTAKD